jgi:2-dehydropantoate 2-reductase
VSKDKKLLKQAVSVMDEGFQMLERLGYSITPANQVNFIRNHRHGVYYGLKILHKLPFMKLVDGSFSETAALFDAFDKLKRQSNIVTPNWDEFEKQAISKFISSTR